MCYCRVIPALVGHLSIKLLLLQSLGHPDQGSACNVPELLLHLDPSDSLLWRWRKSASGPDKKCRPAPTAYTLNLNLLLPGFLEELLGGDEFLQEEIETTYFLNFLPSTGWVADETVT